MAETAALLADEVLPDRPLRQWVLSLPHALRFLLATNSMCTFIWRFSTARIRPFAPMRLELQTVAPRLQGPEGWRWPAGRRFGEQLRIELRLRKRNGRLSAWRG